MDWRYRRVYYVELKQHHLRPGRVQRPDVPYPYALAIETMRNHAGEDEYVIVLLDENGAPITHDHPFGLDDAFGDVEYELDVKRQEWESI
jgi:hypothetical protein